MTKHLYKDDFSDEDFINYEDYKHTPAYVTNKFVLSKDYEQFKRSFRMNNVILINLLN